MRQFAFLIVSLLGMETSSFYLPGVNPQSFSQGDVVKLKVNKMTSQHTLLPVDYYRLPFCQPEGGIKMDNENLGEFLAGDRIESSPYRLKMKVEMFCEQVCVANLGREEANGVSPNKVVRAIRKGYHNNWIVDNLPAASKVEDDKTVTTRYWQGFPVGFVGADDNKAYINNHVNIEIMYHQVETETDKYRVVRFTVEPFSIKHAFEEVDDDDKASPDDSSKPFKVADITNPIYSCDPKRQKKNHTTWDIATAPGHTLQPASGKVLFTYDVIWIENKELHWASRWDIYLSMDSAIPAKVHWLSILNSLMIVAVLSGMIACILLRNLRRDLARYNRLSQDEESRSEDLEEFGWKLVHADVFRPPSTHPMLLAVFCGTGVQLLCMAFFSIIFSSIGFLSPANRGALVMAQLLLFVLMGSVAGYTTARIYKAFKGKSWQHATALTAFFYPGLFFFVFIILNIVARIQESSDAVPFGTLVVLLVLWFGISTPLVFFGAYFGYRQETFDFPTKVSSIPRQIPDQPWYMGLPFTLFVGGILPFGACFVELYFILASVWMDQYYYVFGFLLLVFLILILTATEINVLFNYFQLCGENYHWWWRSFATAGSTAFYVFLYSIIYFQSLQANTLPTYMLYFGYMSLVSLGIFLMLGACGLFSSLLFNRLIFSSIKVD
eukprot:CAMPEP_0172414914 /NCGR_PEP_ID=MMETSP1064-20121228/1510_1 /TAXON_ID=202472 /ORGANISM="Aulacoseira subarctica , Strain CCAP 1002/5" /LENGTH=665 /DNA_ID=CAMNT_0013151785 /DNA_START=27 /DNA_END=2024 /DNA_ORIENTATION=+